MDNQKTIQTLFWTNDKYQFVEIMDLVKNAGLEIIGIQSPAHASVNEEEIEGISVLVSHSEKISITTDLTRGQAKEELLKCVAEKNQMKTLLTEATSEVRRLDQMLNHMKLQLGRKSDSEKASFSKQELIGILKKINRRGITMLETANYETLANELLSS